VAVERGGAVSFAAWPPPEWGPRRIVMADLVFIGVTLGFFLIAIGYVFACGRL